jgi:enoyl-CoA hydratase/carnithine racemase
MVEGIVNALDRLNADTSVRVASLTGAGSAFGETGLTGAVQSFREMVGPDANYVMARIKTLLVPPALEVPAKNWMNSTTVVGGTSKAPGSNLRRANS